MPYIKQERRVEMNVPCQTYQVAMNPGELNYDISRLLDLYLRREGMNYTTLNAAIGALECAKLELYRRIAAPYEDRKIEENGDVYTVAP